jgi:hypothetical protein
MAKQSKSKYKYLRPEQIEEFSNMTPELLISEYLKDNKSLKFLVQERKDDTNLTQLKQDIKKHRETHLPDKIKQLKLEIKEIKDEVDDEIRDLLDEKKDVEGGYRDSINSYKEKINLILNLIDKKTVKK